MWVACKELESGVNCHEARCGATSAPISTCVERRSAHAPEEDENPSRQHGELVTMPPPPPPQQQQEPAAFPVASVVSCAEVGAAMAAGSAGCGGAREVRAPADADAGACEAIDMDVTEDGEAAPTIATATAWRAPMCDGGVEAGPSAMIASAPQQHDAVASAVATAHHHHRAHSDQEEEEEDDEEAGNVEAEVADDPGTFNPYLFIKRLPPYHQVWGPRKAVLPESCHPHRKTLVLDLDETLVHCTVDAVERPDVVLPVCFNGVEYRVCVRKRPHLHHFLAAVSRLFEVVVFTASQKVYADALLDAIDPEGTLVHHRLFREACLAVDGNYLKDLNVLGRDLSSVVLVDNSPHCYGYQLDNGVPIVSWYDDPRDTELLKLLSFLQQLAAESGDVRPVLRQQFRTHVLVAEAS
ncbi:unnamed protein product [Phaeothamnion confervicola]